MTYYEKNRKAIQDCRPYFSEKLKAYTAEQHNDDSEAIELITTKDGNSTLQIRKQSNTFRLNSLYSPTHEAERWIQQFDMNNIEIVVSMFGLGNGVFVREMIKKMNNQGMLFIYEPSRQLFFYILEHYDLSDIISSNNVSITVEGINDNEIKNLLSNNIYWLNLRSQIICVHPQYDRIYQDSLSNFYTIIQDNNDKTVINKNTDSAICNLIIDNMLRNLKLVKHSNVVTDFVGLYPEEVPAIIVAAGPSLDKNIDELKNAKGKAVIFAVDTAVKYLLAHNIEPDFIVTLDPKKSLWHLSDPRCKYIPIYSRFDSRPENIEQNLKRVIFFNIEGYVKNIYQRLGIYTGDIYSGGSVATGAFSICEMIGFKRIIMVGQDLAYSGEYTHAGGLVVDVSGAGRDTKVVEDINGNPITTRYDWYIYIRWFEDAVELFKGDVIDATEGGAKIKGTTIMTLKQAIDKYCIKEIDCEQILSTLPPTLNLEQLELFVNYIKQDTNEIKNMKPVLEEANQICDRLIEKYNKSIEETNSSIIKNNQLKIINEKLEKESVYELIDWDITRTTDEQIADIYVQDEDEQKNKIRTYKQAKVIYTAMLNSIDRIMPIMEEGYQALVEND